MTTMPSARTRVNLVPTPERFADGDPLDVYARMSAAEVAAAIPLPARRQSIRTDLPEHLVADAAEAAIAGADLDVFQHGSALVRVVDRPTGATLHRVDHHGLLDLYSRAVDFQKMDNAIGAYISVPAPERVARIHQSRGSWPKLPHLRGLVAVPTVRLDGTLLDQNGFDIATSLFYAAAQGFVLPDIPAAPSSADALAALDVLGELLDGFPFAGPADRSVAFAAMLTTVVRGAIANAPLFAIRASTPGSGKSYFVDVVSTLATGRPAPVLSAGPDEAETEKRLAGLLLSGTAIVSLDNVNGELGGDLLCQAVTQPSVRVRRLGGSDIAEVESRALLLATGNGLRVRGDMVRRTLLCTLDAGVERPELRRFNSDPVKTARADRGRYVAAALTVLRAHALAGAPGPRPIGSFDHWNVVRAALVWLGQPDPADTMEAARAEDPELELLGEVIATWNRELGTGRRTVRELVDAAEERGANPWGDADGWRYPDWRDVALRIAGERGQVSTRRLGNWLRARAGRIHADRQIAQAGIREGARTWAIEIR